jgi:hypothetical protein
MEEMLANLEGIRGLTYIRRDRSDQDVRYPERKAMVVQ